MKTRKISKALVLLLAVVFCCCGLVITGCGGSSSDIEGSWRLDGLNLRDKSYAIEDLARAVHSNQADAVSLVLEADGDGNFTLYGQDGETAIAGGTYRESEDGYLFSVDGGKHSVKAAIEDGKLILHDDSSAVKSKMIFVKE